MRHLSFRHPSALRKLDRELVPYEHFPALHFPEAYLLEGGYNRFVEEFPHHCGGYVRMDADARCTALMRCVQCLYRLDCRVDLFLRAWHFSFKIHSLVSC